MRIQVTGKQIDVGDALREHVQAELAAAVSKYADVVLDAEVVFSRDAHTFRADAVVKLARGLTAKASNKATEIYAAFDGLSEKIEKQVRRYKRRLIHHRGDAASKKTPAASYVLAGARDEDEESESLNPVVIAEMKAQLLSLSVGEAVMRMELEDAPFLMFRNDAHGRLNIVFRRDDGNIGWIDPENLAA
ncbi:ribosome hibernation-promoting factor, HPF/YfiA family [Pikeienuella sp. HZG-20]|uniref:ribosome hibernation-promoting factor, HPF/YfiA family n=1 Tax=Paludibacillus litoralis TaxID=3133267 RepID=UPI0030EE83AF